MKGAETRCEEDVEGKREKRKSRGGGFGTRVMGRIDATVRMTGGPQSPEQLSKRDFRLSEYMNMFQYAHVFIYRSLLFCALSTRSSRVLTLLTLLSHMAMEGGLGSFQHSVTQALAALVKWQRIDFLYVRIGICEQWSRKKTRSCWNTFYQI